MFLPIVFLVLCIHIEIEVVGANVIEDDLRLMDDSMVANPNVRSKSMHRYRKNEDCSDEELRKIMHSNIADNSITNSKKNLHNAITDEYEGNWNILCAGCPFSYLAHTQDYCIHSRYGITCLAYRS